METIAGAIAACLAFIFIGFGALFWGGQGDGYHSNPRDAEETGNFIAALCLIAVVIIIVGTIMEEV